MAQPSSSAQNLAPEIRISAPISPNPIIRQPEAAPAPEAKPESKMVPLTTESLKAPVTAPSNPVAEVQAKLRAALVETPKPSALNEVVFKTLTTLACVLTLTIGLALGVACVLLGAAIFLFPVTAGLSLAFVVAGSAYLGYRLYAGSSKAGAKGRPEDSPNDIFEALSAGRFNAAGVA